MKIPYAMRSPILQNNMVSRWRGAQVLAEKTFSWHILLIADKKRKAKKFKGLPGSGGIASCIQKAKRTKPPAQIPLISVHPLYPIAAVRRHIQPK